MNHPIPFPSPNAPASARSDDAAFLYRFAAELRVIPIGIVPEGLRMTVEFDGRVVDGMLVGARVWGIDHLLLRRDGVGVIEAQKTIARGDAAVYEHVRGYCKPPPGVEMPSLEALLEPEFVWPDRLFPIVGASTFRTAVPDLVHLNDAIATIGGFASFARGRNVVETRLLRDPTLTDDLRP